MRGSDEYAKLRLALMAWPSWRSRGTHGAAASTGPEAAGVTNAGHSRDAFRLEGQHPAQRAGHSEAGAQQPVLHGLGAPVPCDPLVLALQMPGDGRLERLLVRAGAPAQHALGLRGPVGPAVPGGAHL